MQRFRIIFWTIDSCKMANWNISAYIHFYLQTCFQEPLFFRIQVFLSTLVLFVNSLFHAEPPWLWGVLLNFIKSSDRVIQRALHFGWQQIQLIDVLNAASFRYVFPSKIRFSPPLSFRTIEYVTLFNQTQGRMFSSKW